MILQHGVVINCQSNLSKEEVGLVPNGTVVVVHNLFGDIPVRLKQLSLRYSSSSETVKAFDRIKEMLVGYLLACPRSIDLRFCLQGEKQNNFRHSTARPGSNQFSISSIVPVLFSAKLLTTTDMKHWRSASVRTSQVSIRAALSTEPSPSKNAQFLSIGPFPIRRDQGIRSLFETIDTLFEASNFGVSEQDSGCIGLDRQRDPGHTTTERGKLLKGVDRWPKFYIRIDSKSENLSWLAEQDEPSSDERLFLDHLTKALESLISHFLITSGYVPKDRVVGSRNGRPGRNNEEHLRGDLSPLLSTPDLSRRATEARYLNYWRRVKSARHSGEDFRYSLGMGKLEVDSTPHTWPQENQPVPGNSCLLEIEPRIIEDDTVVDSGLEPDSESSLLWTNPRNGQIVHLNPRTGAIIPSSCQIDLDLEKSGKELTKSQLRPREVREAPLSTYEAPKARAARSAINLQKYMARIPFHETEAPIPCVLGHDALGLIVNQSKEEPKTNATFDLHAITGHALANATAIQQVDQKFVLATVTVPGTHNKAGDGTRLTILIDQHAADERVRFEKLCQEVCKRASSNLSQPLIFEVQENEAKRFEEYSGYFQKWCFKYAVYSKSASAQASATVSHHQRWSIEVTRLPSLIAERCRTEPKLLIDLMRREIWSGRTHIPRSSCESDEQKRQSWWAEIAQSPEGMVEMLKSRSCRTAIMFNDSLDKAQCRELVHNLARCTFPFQCAHGRPTLTVLAHLDGLDYSEDQSAIGYGDAWRGWVEAD